MAPLRAGRVSVLALVLLGTVVAATSARANGPAGAYYANDADGIFWFMHISDVHVGCSTSLETGGPFPDPQNFQFALAEAQSVIAPAFIVNTGDLVNGSANNIPTSGQAQWQWDDYKSYYTAAGMTASYYYDIVGNHDEYARDYWPFNECPSLHWYLNNSLQGQATGAAHFSWTHTTVLGDYFFYGLNMTGDCVPAFSAGDGTLLDGEFTAVTAALDANASAQLQFVFAHQGPAQPQNSARLMDPLVQHGVFYIHGHVHEYKEYLAGNAGGDIVVNEVSTLGKGDSDNIGVGVIDHDAFIYRATSTSSPWPFVIVTAPVGTQLRDGELNPWAYDVCKDRVNPIRALVFAKQHVTSVTAQVAGLPPVTLSQVQGPLYAGVVDTTDLSAGLQNVVVTATAGGTTATETVMAEFYSGPCTVPADGGVAQDGGAPTDATPPADGGGVGSDAGSLPGDGGVPAEDAAPGADDGGAPAGDDAAAADGAPDAGADNVGSGCSCRAAATPGSGPGLVLLVLGVLGAVRRARRRQP